MTTQANETSVRKEIVVEAPIERAFSVFTEDFDNIKPRDHNMLAVEIAETVFEAREGGSFRISLTYDEPIGTGKTTAHTDTYHGHFAKLVPNKRVVEVAELETEDPALRGEMAITITLADADGGTNLLAVHDGLPPGLYPADNEAGWRLSLGKLAALVESRA